MTLQGVLIDAAHPWPGLVAFDEGAQAFFFGREEAIENLVSLIERDVGVTLFGRSGLGKTSLLHAGVFPRLRARKYLPVSIRLAYHQEQTPSGPSHNAARLESLRDQIADPVPDLIVQIAQRLFQCLDEAGVAYPALAPNDDVWSYLHRRDVVEKLLKNNVVPVLVFDQFEELFTRGMGDAMRRPECLDVLDMLADLIQGRLPSALRERIEATPDLLADYRFDEPSYRVVIALREDYLPFLEELSARAPMFNRSRFRLLPMTRMDALLAIEGPGQRVVDTEVATLIVNVLAGEDAAEPDIAEIDPSILSLLCHELNNRRLNLGQPVIDASIVSNERDQVLENFYERCFDGIPETVRDLVERELITESGVRVDFSLDNAVRVAGQGRRPFELLTARRLLRLEERQGSPRIELVHDILVEPVRRSAERRARERDVADAQTRQREDSRRRFARLRRIAVLSLLGLVVLGALLAVWLKSQTSQRQAQAQTQMVTCVMRLLANDGEQAQSSSSAPRGMAALIAATGSVQTADCGPGLAELLHVAGKPRAATIHWAVGLSTLPTAEDPVTKVARIEAALGLEKTGKDIGRGDDGDTDAKLAEAEVWKKAEKLQEAADATAKAASLYVSGSLRNERDAQLRLADILVQEGEYRTDLLQWPQAQAALTRALAIREHFLLAPVKQIDGFPQADRLKMAQAYAAVGRFLLMRSAARNPQDFAAIAQDIAVPKIDTTAASTEKTPSFAVRAYRAAITSKLTKNGYHFYELCQSSGPRSAGEGLQKGDPVRDTLAAFCLNHRFKSLVKGNATLAKASVSKLLGRANVDLNAIPESEKQNYYDLLQFMSTYYQNEFIQDPSNTDARDLAGTYSRWLVKATRDVLAQDFSIEHANDLIHALNQLSRYYQLVKQPDDAMKSSAQACLINSKNVETYVTWGTALFQKGQQDDARTMYARAKKLDPTAAYTLLSQQSALLNRANASPGVEMSTAIATPGANNDTAGTGQCDDRLSGSTHAPSKVKRRS